METSRFFNAQKLANGTFDRVYSAENFAEYFASFIGNGVFRGKGNELQVVVGGNFWVSIKSGQGYINGYWYQNDADASFNVGIGNQYLPRIDAVVLRLDLTARAVKLAYKQGVESSSPVPPTMERNQNVWELCLATVNVSVSGSSISALSITDTRSDTGLCGFIHGLNKINDALADKLGKTEQAADSAKLGGKLPTAFASASHTHWKTTLTGGSIDFESSTDFYLLDSSSDGTFPSGVVIDANNPALLLVRAGTVSGSATGAWQILFCSSGQIWQRVLSVDDIGAPTPPHGAWQRIDGLGSIQESSEKADNIGNIAEGSGTDTSTLAQTGATVWGMLQNIWNRLHALAEQEGAKGDAGRQMFSVSATTSTTAQVNTNAPGARIGDYLLVSPTAVNGTVTIAGTARAAGTLWEISTLPASGNITVTARGTIQGATGAAGTNAIASYTENIFQQSTSGTTVPTGTWSNSPPTAIAGQFMWTRTTITWNNGETSTIDSVAANGADGGNGDSSNIVNYDIVGNYTPLEDDILNAFALTGASVLMGMYENSTIESTIGLGSYIATRTLQNIGLSMESTITIFVIRDDGSVFIGLGWGTSFNWKIGGGGGIPGMDNAGIGTVPVKTANGIEWMTYQQWYNNYGYY